MTTSDDTHFFRVGLTAVFLVAILTIVALVGLVMHGPAAPSGHAQASSVESGEDQNALGMHATSNRRSGNVVGSGVKQKVSEN